MGKFLSAIILFFGSPAISVVAQAWVQPVDNYYVKFSHGRLSTDSRFDLEGASIPYDASVQNGRFVDNSYYVYGEYGLTRSVTGVLLLPIKSLGVESDEGENSTTGIGRIYLGTRFDLSSIVPDPLVAAVQIGGRLPTGNARNLAPSVDSGQIDLEGSFATGRGWKAVYTQAEIGFRLRPSWYGLSRSVDCANTSRTNCGPDTRGDFADEWFYKIELGGSPHQRALVQLILTSTNSVAVGEEMLDPNNPISESSKVTTFGLGGTVYPTDGLGISVQYFNAIDGVNTLDAATLFFGIEVMR